MNTGATSGIGLAAAMQFAQQGAFVIGVGRSEARNQQALQSILAWAMPCLHKNLIGGVNTLQHLLWTPGL
jgi:NAD(P)-dependent dehydrogenase (short-subunit alcohol dehydrogenase family)